MFDFSHFEMMLGRVVERYQKLELEIRHLSGYDLNELKWLFAAGYTLTPPDLSNRPSLAEIAECCDKFWNP